MFCKIESNFKSVQFFFIHPVVGLGNIRGNNLTIIVKKIITILDIIAINAIKTMTTFFNFN